MGTTQFVLVKPSVDCGAVSLLDFRYMPRISPLPQPEAAIGKRLRQAREKRLIPRTSFALKCGLSPNRLVNYEIGRAVLPWDVAKLICDTFFINPVWLYNGTGSPHGQRGVLDQAKEPPARASFASVMEELLHEQPDLAERIAAVQEHSPAEGAPAGPFLTEKQWSGAISFASGPLSQWLDQLSPADTGAFIAELTKAGEKVFQRFQKPRR